MLRSRENILLILLGTAVLSAVSYGVVTYQTPYGCGPSGVASGPSIDWQVLVEPCIYVYFTGIVGGSVLLILLIPAREKKSSSLSKALTDVSCNNVSWRDNINLRRVRTIRGKAHDSRWRHLRFLENTGVVAELAKLKENELGVCDWLKGPRK